MFDFLRYLKRSPNLACVKDKAQVDKEYKYWRLRILYSMYFGYVLFYFTRKNLVFILPALVHQLHFSKEELGLLGTAFYITYGISKFLSGMLSDKSNPRYFMAFGLVATGIANICFGFSSSLWLLTIIWIANGFFQGWGWPPCARLLTHWYSQRERGFWWGVWNTSHNVGGGLIPIIAGLCALYWGWRFAMFVPGVIAIVMGLVLINRLRDVPESEGLPPVEEYKDDYPNKKKTLDKELPTKEILKRYILKNKYIWLLAVAFVLVYIVRTGINDWGALFLTDRGNSLLSSDSVLSFFEVGGFAGGLTAGIWSDKIRRGPVNVLFSAGIIFALILFWFVPHSGHFLQAACLFGIGFFVFGPQLVISMAAVDLCHREAAGAVTGFVGLFGYLGAALSGFPIGYVTQHWGWLGFFVALGACGVLTTLLLIPLWSVKTHQPISEEVDEEVMDAQEA